MLKGLAGQLGLFVQIGCWFHLFQQYVVETSMCVGPSMYPTFNVAGDIVIVKRGRMELEKGDIVVAQSPQEPGKVLAKRITGMPGDQLPSSRLSLYAHTVPEGHIWLVGDNLSNSRDSRDFGPVPIGLVRGKIVAKVWPLTEAKIIRRGPPPYANDF